MLGSPLASLAENLETQGEKYNRSSDGNWEQLGLGKELRCQAYNSDLPAMCLYLCLLTLGTAVLQLESSLLNHRGSRLMRQK